MLHTLILERFRPIALRDFGGDARMMHYARHIYRSMIALAARMQQIPKATGTRTLHVRCDLSGVEKPCSLPDLQAILYDALRNFSLLLPGEKNVVWSGVDWTTGNEHTVTVLTMEDLANSP